MSFRQASVRCVLQVLEGILAKGEIGLVARCIIS